MVLKETSGSRRLAEPAHFVFLPSQKSTQKNEKHKIHIQAEEPQGVPVSKAEYKKKIMENTKHMGRKYWIIQERRHIPVKEFRQRVGIQNSMSKFL